MKQFQGRVMLVLMTSLIVSACATPTPVPPPAPTKAPAASAPAAITLPAAPAATKAPEPTRGPAVVQPLASPVPANRADGQLPLPQTENSAALVTRLVIQSAQLVLSVLDLEARLTQVYQLTTEARGYLSELSVTKEASGARATFRMRVPSDRLDFTLNALRKLAVEVKDQRLQGEDVTAEYSDLSQTVLNLESAELQYRDIMKRMDKPEDIIRIFNELTRIRGEIEKLKGRMTQLSRLAAMATVDVTLIELLPLQPTATPTMTPTPTSTPTATPTSTPTPAWNAGVQIQSAGGQFARRSESLMTGLIWFAVRDLPFVLLVALVLAFLAPILRVARRTLKLRLPARSRVQSIPPALAVNADQSQAS